MAIPHEPDPAEGRHNPQEPRPLFPLDRDNGYDQELLEQLNTYAAANFALDEGFVDDWEQLEEHVGPAVVEALLEEVWERWGFDRYAERELGFRDGMVVGWFFLSSHARDCGLDRLPPITRDACDALLQEIGTYQTEVDGVRMKGLQAYYSDRAAAMMNRGGLRPREGQDRAYIYAFLRAANDAWQLYIRTLGMSEGDPDPFRAAHSAGFYFRAGAVFIYDLYKRMYESAPWDARLNQTPPNGGQV